jgi:hypothetical protein
MRRREDVAFGSMLLNNFAAGSVCSLSRRERGGVRGFALSIINRHP